MRRFVSWSLVVGVATLAGAAAGVAVGPGLAWAEKEGKDKVVHELMEKTHEGKNSPWKGAQRAASKDPVDWAALGGALPRLDEMSKALANSKDKEIRELSDSYVTAVKALGASATKKDAVAARAAIESLSKSCADCHFKGGPGGKLEDD